MELDIPTWLLVPLLVAFSGAIYLAYREEIHGLLPKREPMKTKWQLREPYFQGANTYKIGPEGQEIEVAVDKNGVFELDAPPTFPIGIFAKNPS